MGHILVDLKVYLWIFRFKEIKVSEITLISVRKIPVKRVSIPISFVMILAYKILFLKDIIY